VIGLTEGKIRRKTFAAREDLIDQMSRIAKQRGFTLYDYVNDLFKAAIQAEEDGMNLQILIEKRELVSRAKKAGFILCPERLWYDMIELGYSSNKNKAIERWSEAGTLLAKRYASNGAADPIMSIIADYEDFAWHVPPMIAERTSGELSVNVSVSKFSESHTILYGKFLEGILNAYGYNKIESDITAGNICLRAIEEGEDGE
jgi:hypothetical protein